MKGGYACLCAVIDWHSRCVLAWELSNTLDASFCVRTVQRALDAYGTPKIFNTDQGCQFTQSLLALGVKLSDGKGYCLDNVFVERLWRSVKSEEVYLKCYVSLVDAHAQLENYLTSTTSAGRTPRTTAPPHRLPSTNDPHHAIQTMAPSNLLPASGHPAGEEQGSCAPLHPS